MIIIGIVEEDKEMFFVDVDVKDDVGGLVLEIVDEMDVVVVVMKASGVVFTGKVVGIIRRNWCECGYVVLVDMGRDGKGLIVVGGGFVLCVLCVLSDRWFLKICI